jgi:aspartate aminotransferase
VRKESNINTLRKEIKKITIEIFKLIGKRMLLVREIGEKKRRKALSIEDLAVESRLRKSVLEKCEAYGVNPNFGVRILNLLIEEAKTVQNEMFEKYSIEKAKLITPYAFFTKARQMERNGKSVIHLEIGEPDFGPPEKVQKTLEEAVRHGYVHYTESFGIPPLREKIAENVNQNFNVNISPNQIIATVGGRCAVFLCIASTLLSGDEAIIFAPAWPAYENCVRDVGGRPIIIPTFLEKNWEPNIDYLLKYINKSTKMIILNNPNNPTGKIFDEKLLKQIVDVAKEKNILILSDEVYSNFSFTPFKSILEFPECNQVYVSSFSKKFGMTGFRIGYAISDIGTIEKMGRLQNLILTSVPEFVQHVAIAALDCVDEAQKYAKTIKDRIKRVSDALNKTPFSYYIPEGGFYFFPKIKDRKMSGQAFAERLLSEKGVCVTPGTAFGKNYKYFFRMSVCQPYNVLLAAVQKMEDLFQ